MHSSPLASFLVVHFPDFRCNTASLSGQDSTVALLSALTMPLLQAPFNYIVSCII